MDKCSYCGAGNATISKHDKIYMQLGDSSARILEQLEDKEVYKQAGARRHHVLALATRARSPQVQHNIVAYTAGGGGGGGIAEYIAH